MSPFRFATMQIPPMPDPDPVDPPGQDDLPDLPPEPLRDPQRMPSASINGSRMGMPPRVRRATVHAQLVCA